MTSPGDAELANLVEDVMAASLIPARQRGTSIRPTVDRLCSGAYEHGLLPELLEKLVGLVTSPNQLDQASLGAIARHLYAASGVPGDLVVKLVGCLGHGELKPSLPLQTTLLKWLIMVYHVMDQPKMLSRAYQVLFNLLDTSAIRPQVCHVLALITRRKHVQPFRIQAVLNLSRQTGNDPALVGLLRVYKDYYPEIIVGDAVKGKASAFKHPDLQWRQRLDEVQENRFRLAQNGTASRQHGFQVVRQLGRTRKSVVPTVRTAHATEESVTLEEMDNVDNFVQNLENIRLPNQLVAVLADPLLQKLLLLRPEEEALQRIHNWVLNLLQDIRSGEADASTTSEVLGVLHEYILVVQEMPLLVLNFFVEFLQSWNGRDGREEVLQLLAHVPLEEYSRLRENIFGPLERQVLDGNPRSQLAMLEFYTRLFNHWYTLLLATDKVPDYASPTLSAVVEHVQQLSLALTQTVPQISTHMSIVDFFEQYSAIISDQRLREQVRIVIPPRDPLIYTLFFSQSLAVVSRLCAVLCCYKKAIEMAMAIKSPSKKNGTGPPAAAAATATTQQNPTPVVHAEVYEPQETSRFNGFIMDICNCILRMHAFSVAEPNAAGCLVPRSTYAAFGNYVESMDTNVSLAALFGVSLSPVLSLQSILAVRDLEDEAVADKGRPAPLAARHAGPVTQTTLAGLRNAGGLSLSWGEYRVAVLHRLEARGFTGISELAKNTMKTLMKPRVGAVPRAAH